MSKNRKSRRKSRNRKSAANIGASTTAQENHAIPGPSPTASKPQHDNEIFHEPDSNLCDNQSTDKDRSERKRKNLPVDESVSTTKRKKNKRRRTTTCMEPAQSDTCSKSTDECIRTKLGAFFSSLFTV